MLFKTGIIGGTFDPIHLGHLNAACFAMKTLNLDTVEFRPNSVPYYRPQPRVSDTDRLAMVKLATADEKKFSVNDVEIKSKIYTSTYETMHNFREKHPEDAAVFIMGMDSFLNMYKWIKGSEILNYGSIAVLVRPGYVLDRIQIPNQLLCILDQHLSSELEIKRTAGDIFFIPNDPADISSTKIRSAVKKNDIAYLKKWLPHSVLEYIIKHRLYR